MVVERGSYTKRADRSVPVDILSSSQLVEKEHEALRLFFGKEVPVVSPPPELFETQKVAEAEGFGIILEPLYFLAVVFKKADRYPGWKAKPNKWYWDQIRLGKVREDAAKLGGYWGLFDKSRRPNYNGNRQMFTGDPLAPMLSQARREGRIAVPNYVKNVPEGSRFAVSPDEQDQTVFPQLAEILRLAEGVAEVRRPTLMELNFAGNLRYPHLGKANTWESLDDDFVDNGRLVGGKSDRGDGLKSVYYGWSDAHEGIVAFRPLVVFPPKTG